MIVERIKAYEQAASACCSLHFHPMIEGFDQFVEEIMPPRDSPTRRAAGAPAR